MTRSSEGTQPPTQKPDPELIEQHLLAMLDQAMGMELDISDDETAYDIAYVAQKLAKCSSITEKLSNLVMEITKTGLAVTKHQRNIKRLLDIKEKELKASPEYDEQSRAGKGHWIQQELGGQREELERWTYLSRVVSEVKDAVMGRAQDIKRLDSDLRLHQRLLEGKPSYNQGPQDPRKFPGGGSAKDLNLDLTKD